MSEKNPQKDEFLKASKEKDSSLVAEFIGFMKENKKWWLAPIPLLTRGSGVAI